MPRSSSLSLSFQLQLLAHAEPVAGGEPAGHGRLVGGRDRACGASRRKLHELPLGPRDGVAAGVICVGPGAAPPAAAPEGPGTPTEMVLGRFGEYLALLPATTQHRLSDELWQHLEDDAVDVASGLDERLEAELRRASAALVSQRHDGDEFNIPSRLMNFMAHGLPLLAAVDPRGEVARIVGESAGWMVASARPEAFPEKVEALVENRDYIQHRGRAAAEYAEQHFSQGGFAERFEGAIGKVLVRVADHGRFG